MATVLNKADPKAVDPSYDNDLFAITPSDTLRLRSPIQALYVGVGGDVAFVNPRQEVQVITYVAGGPYYVGGITKIMSTGTTATGLKGLTAKGLR